MKRPKDFERIKQCLGFIRIKSLDYGLVMDDSVIAYFEKLTTRISIYGDHLDKLDKHLRDTMFNALKANKCTIKDETALVALEIIKKNCREYMELTDTYPKEILKMNAKEIFNIIKEFDDEPRNVRIAAYALGQYKITATKDGPVKEPPEFETEEDDEDWIDLEEEEDDENQFIDDKDEYR